MAMLSNEEIQNKLKNFPGWELDTPFLRKEFTFPTFTDAMIFVNEVAQAAEDLEHHPDITIHHNVVKLSTTTMSQMALTDKDFDLIKRVQDAEKMIFKDLSKE